MIARYKGQGCLQSARIGTCGRFSFVKQSDGYAGTTKYFDASGALVAVEGWSDANSFCDGKAFGGTFGAREVCAPATKEDLCPATPDSGAGSPWDDGL